MGPTTCCPQHLLASDHYSVLHLGQGLCRTWGSGPDWPEPRSLLYGLSEEGLCASNHSSPGILTSAPGNPWGKECGDSISGMQQVLRMQVLVLGNPPFTFALSPISNTLFAINTSFLT